MKYDISNPSAPKMPNLGKGTECIKFLLTQASKDMHEPLVPMLFPSLGAHISGAKFRYPGRSWKEPTGMMANLVAKSGAYFLLFFFLRFSEVKRSRRPLKSFFMMRPRPWVLSDDLVK